MKPHRLLLLLWLMLCSVAAHAQDFPKLSGRVVDAANLLDPQQEAALAAKLDALEKASSRQLVVATVPDLGGYPIEDYGYRLGRAWGIGQSEANNGTILLVAPAERKVRIEVGYGLEPILTDALTALIIHNAILPRFREGDMAGGILAGADAVIQQLQAPPEEAEQRALAAAEAAQQSRQSGGGGGSLFPLIFWGVVLVFIVIPMLRGRGRGRRTRRGGMPVILWGPGLGGGGGGFGGGGGGGFGGFGGGGGGFSGGGGSFGGGGASGGW